MQAHFYSKLYSTDCDVEFTFRNDTESKLSQEDKEVTNKPLTMDEIYTALQTLHRNRTPGVTVKNIPTRENIPPVCFRI